MIPKSSWLYAIGLLKCPRCHVGDMYETPTFSFKKPFDMRDKCPHCAQRFTLETGFYYGAMFISYIVSAFMMFGIFAIFMFILDFDVYVSFYAAMAIIIALYVWLFRVSRTIWLSFFVKFEKTYANE